MRSGCFWFFGNKTRLIKPVPIGVLVKVIEGGDSYNKGISDTKFIELHNGAPGTEPARRPEAAPVVAPHGRLGHLSVQRRRGVRPR